MQLELLRIGLGELAGDHPEGAAERLRTRLGSAAKNVQEIETQLTRLRRWLALTAPGGETADLAGVVADVVRETQSIAERTGGSLALEGGAAELVVRGSGDDLRWAVLHLVLDEIDRSRGGTVRARVERDGDDARLVLACEPGGRETDTSSAGESAAVRRAVARAVSRSGGGVHDRPGRREIRIPLLSAGA
jgi:signal transduction histidine kinase